MNKLKLVAAFVLPFAFVISGCNNEPSPIPVEDITLSDTSVTLTVDTYYRLVATVTPDNATDKSVTWSSSDESIVAVTEGLLDLKGVGACTITATTVDGEKIASCIVNSLPKETSHDANYLYLLNSDKNAYSIYYIGNKDVEELTIPDNHYNIPVTTIADNSFRNLSSLKTLRLSTNITSVGEGAFADNTALENIYYGAANAELLRVNDQLISLDFEVGKNTFENVNLPYVSLDGHNVDGDIVVTQQGLENKISKIEYTVAMNEDSPYKATGNINTSDLSEGHSVKIPLGAHGLYKMSNVALYAGEQKYAEIALPNLGVYTDEYNIAMLTATYPTTIFTLKAPEITNNGAIPTYVLLERYAAYNWDKLQWNIRELPNISHADATHAGNTRFFEAAHIWMADYIRDLHEINPESRFHFFFTDLSVDYFYYTVVSQGISEDLYSLVLLSDGTASADILNRTYGVWAQDNPDAKHTSLLNSIKKIKAHLEENGWDASYIATNLSEANGDRSTYTKPSYFFANHAYTTLCLFDNAEWWLNRLRAGENLTAVKVEFVNKILATTGLKQNIYANSLLAGLNEENQAKFKTLFHFDSDSFNASREAGHKIMVILGTSWSGEGDLYNLIKATILYYGKGYDYYYKPHPGFPSSNYPGRQEIFARLNNEGWSIEEIDGAVAAEIIMYFNTDIYLSGYSSTTYTSLDEHNNGMGACDWTTNTAEYVDYMFTYLSLATTEERAAYSLVAEKTYYVVHVNSNGENAQIKAIYDVYDTAIVCLEDNIVTYYKGGVQVTL